MLKENHRASSDNCSSNVVVIGVDILPGYSPSSSKQPHYAMAVLKDGKIIDKYEDVSLSRMLRLVWEYKPSIIAIDNVYELASSDSKLAKLFTLLPPGTNIVQVTGWGSNTIDIKNLARSIGINVEGKLTPLKTAIIAALIAWKGYGYKVRLLEEKTKIIVVRGRSVSHGGMSYNRYVRSIRSGILAITKEIKRILDRNGFDYDLVFKKAKGGLERSVFIVYAPREKLYGLIKPVNTKSIRVIIQPVYKNKVVFDGNLKKKDRPVIVGIDPGVNTGIAVIDLNGTPLFIHSSKNIDRNDIINMILAVGSPVIIATDVAEVPETVKKLAAMVKAQLYVPSRNLSSAEKNEIVNNIVKKYPWISINDTHERDALVAAYKAYQSLEDKFKHIEHSLKKYGITLDEDRIKVAIIKGKTLAEAIEEELERIMEQDIGFSQEQTESIKQEQKRESMKSSCEKRIETKIRILEAEKKRLIQEIKDLTSRLEALELELKNLKSLHDVEENVFREIEKLRLENKSLREQIRKLKEDINKLVDENNRLRKTIKTIVFNNYVPIPVVYTPTPSNIAKVLDLMQIVKAFYTTSIKNICYDVLRYLEEKRIAVIVDEYKERFLYNKVPVISLKNFKHFLIDDILFVEPTIISTIDELWKTIDEMKKEEEYMRVCKLIKEYQEMRKKKFGLKNELSRL